MRFLFLFAALALCLSLSRVQALVQQHPVAALEHAFSASFVSLLESVAEAREPLRFQAQASTECNAAVTAVDSTAKANCGDILDRDLAAEAESFEFGKGGALNVTQTCAVFDAQTECYTAMDEAFKTAMTTCGAEYDGVRASLAPYAKLRANPFGPMCIFDDANPEQRCMAVLMAHPVVEAVVSSGGVGVDIAALAAQVGLQESLCKPCIAKLIDFMVGHGKADDATAKLGISGIQAICIKAPDNKYCFPGIPTLLLALNNMPADPSTFKPDEATRKMLCSPCTGALAAQINFHLAPFLDDATKQKAASLGMLPAMCKADPTRPGPCSETLPVTLSTFMAGAAKTLASLASSCPELLAGTPLCKEKCAKAVTGVLPQLGCCLGVVPPSVIVAKIKEMAAKDESMTLVSNAVAAAFELCPAEGLELPKACGSTSFNVRFVLPNLKKTWVDANQDEFEAAFIKDIAAALNVDANSIVIAPNGIQADGVGGVIVTLKINTDTSVVGQMQTTINNKIANNEIPLQNTAALDANSRIDTDAGASVSPKSGNSGAMAAQVTLATLAAFFMALLALRFH